MVFSSERGTRYDVPPELIKGSAPQHIVDDIQYCWDFSPHGTLDWVSFNNETIESVLEYLTKSSYSRYAPNRPCARNTWATGEGTSSPLEEPLNNNATLPSTPSPRLQTELPVGPPLAQPSQLSDALQSDTPASSAASGSNSRSQSSGRRLVAHKRRTPEIIVHARVYNFARTTKFDALADYTLGRLKARLAEEFQATTDIFPDFGSLIRLMYDRWSESDSVDQRDPAILYLAEFTAHNFRLLGRMALATLLREVGQFAVDVAWRLSHEVTVREREVGRLTTIARGRSPVTMFWERVKGTFTMVRLRPRQRFRRRL
ncbi:hypothetical protein BJY00DRAFT_141138 [Aspergillus carlsbadensis]|nr:hypothetical protein BJY00DRAFT_141138 [Aspergillus carlsbadensis]